MALAVVLRACEERFSTGDAGLCLISFKRSQKAELKWSRCARVWCSAAVMEVYRWESRCVSHGVERATWLSFPTRDLISFKVNDFACCASEPGCKGPH